MRNDLTENEVNKFKITWIHTTGICELIYEIESEEKARMKFYVNFAPEFEIIKIEEIK